MEAHRFPLVPFSYFVPSSRALADPATVDIDTPIEIMAALSLILGQLLGSDGPSDPAYHLIFACRRRWSPDSAESPVREYCNRTQRGPEASLTPRGRDADRRVRVTWPARAPR